MEQEDSEKGAENPPEVSSKAESSKKGDIKDVENPPEGSSKPELSDKNTPQLLKAKSKIVKKSQAGKFMTKTNKGAQLILGEQRKGKDKKVLHGAGSCHNREGYVDKQISENGQQKKTTDEQPKEKSQQTERNKEKESRNSSTSDKPAIKDSREAKKNKQKIIELDKSEQKQKNKEKHGEADMGTSSRTNKDQRGGMEKSQSSKEKKEKLGDMEKSQSSENKKEKLGGLIFMCNAKTKPDCFRYSVMGVSAGKKDVVLGVKPGLKLFLYDFDFKLLYGIYKASSSGGMKLEPRAFSGSFPAQVRFNIVNDCFPLPESIFKKAIKENYDERHRFKTELTLSQVRKLTELFRPVGIHSALQPTRSPPKSIIQDREASDSIRGSGSHSHRERPRDPYSYHVNSYNVLSHERDHRREQREENPRDLFLNEKDYRAYGLQGDRRNMTPPSHVNPILDPYKRGYETEHLHLLDPIYSDNVPAHAESLRSDPHPLYMNGSERQAFVHSAIRDYTKEPYHAYRYGASPRDPHLPPLNSEEISSSSYLVGGRTLIGSDDLQRREAVQQHRHYSSYAAADALSDYNRMQHYDGAKPETTSLPVSSRYSFAGPSYTYR